MTESTVINEIKKLTEKKPQVIVAIDGRCTSGKTTLADAIRKALNCSVVHMDDFFLRPEQRTEERLNTPGGNVDYERVLDEVLVPLRKGEKVAYAPFDCHTQSLQEKIELTHTDVVVIEGSYSCHPLLKPYYDYTVFLDIEPEEQLKRVVQREGKEQLEAFQNKWIPLEEKYFQAFDIKNQCNLY